VADSIANKNMTPEDAAKKWIDANPATWQAWMPS
jgi:glycine betaine/proline transport system substrate-binding protein